LLGLARKRAAQALLPVSLLRASAEAIPFSDTATQPTGLVYSATNYFDETTRRYRVGHTHCCSSALDPRASSEWRTEESEAAEIASLGRGVLARVYAEIWKDVAPAHLIDIALFCDSDDTHARRHQLLCVCPAGAEVNREQVVFELECR